jgi:hypothetical protein
MLVSASMVKRLKNDLEISEEECREQGGLVNSNGIVLAYMDDLFVVNDPDVTAINTPKLSIAYEDHNAKLCIEKSVIIGKGVLDYDDAPHGWEKGQLGGVSVGVPFGDTFWKRDYIREELKKKYPPRLALSILSPRLVVALILLSYSRRGSYLANTSNDLQGILPIAELFDLAMVEALAAVAQVTPTDVIRAIMNFPQRYSGFGLQEIGGLAAEAGQLSGALKAKAFITEYCTPEIIQELNIHIKTDMFMGTAQNLRERTGIENVTYDIMTADTAPRILWKGKDMAQKYKSELLIAELGAEEKTRQHAAALLSKNGSAGSRYLLNGVAKGVENYFPRGDFIQVMRHHLGQQVTNNEPTFRKRPQGGLVYDTASNPSEPLVDIFNKPLATLRHTRVTDALLAAIRRMNPGNYAEPEKEVGSCVTVNENGPDRIAPVIGDIVWLKGAEKIIVEVSVIVPEANSYMTRWNTYLTQDAASEHTETLKRVKYAKVNSINGVNATIPADSVVPFVLESSGRLGPAAFSFINRVFETQTYRRSHLITEIALICAKINGKMLTASRDRYITQALTGG